MVIFNYQGVSKKKINRSKWIGNFLFCDNFPRNRTLGASRLDPMLILTPFFFYFISPLISVLLGIVLVERKKNILMFSLSNVPDLRDNS